MCEDESSLQTTEVPYAERGVIAARRWIRLHLAGLVADKALHDILICADEVVTNAYRHTKPNHDVADGDKIVIFLQWCAHTVRVDVFDNGSPDAIPMLRDSAASTTYGRGLRILDSLATQWGSYSSRNGGAVWFEFETRVKNSPQMDASISPEAHRQ